MEKKKKMMKKLIDPIHVAIGNHGPCHWVSLPSVPKQQGRMNKNGDTETMEENSRREKVDDSDTGRQAPIFVLYVSSMDHDTHVRLILRARLAGNCT